MLAAAATWFAQPFRRLVAAPAQSHRIPVRATPTILQMEWVECGAAAWR